MQLDHATPRRRSKVSQFPMWGVVLAGFTSFGRDFAYLGIAPLFVAEAYLGYAIWRNQRNWISRFVHDCMNFRWLPLAICLHLLWGMFEVAHGRAGTFAGRVHTHCRVQLLSIVSAGRNQHRAVHQCSDLHARF